MYINRGVHRGGVDVRIECCEKKEELRLGFRVHVTAVFFYLTGGCLFVCMSLCDIYNTL